MDFVGFSPDSFEQLIRALSLKIFGPGVTIFGNGPDGGREAVFDGEVPYPFPPKTNWDGYGVIQAKFKEKPEGTKLDQAWAYNQLVTELKAWQNSTARVRKPDYFVYCTNVQLSSTANGGRARLEKTLEDHASLLSLKGFAVWDGNQLCSLIDTAPEIRQRFSCLFTSGDLLHAICQSINRLPNADSILTNYLCAEISADEDAKLSQAGDRSEDRIRLVDVFVDLPSSNHAVFDDEFEADRPGSLNELLKAASLKLDPLALYEQNKVEEIDHQSNPPVYSRFLFLGGPGSGKSTIGQFLAQIHRAALLSRKPSHRLEPKIHSIINEIRTLCQKEKLVWPATPRYPFKIDLNSFANALSQEKNTTSSLSQFIRNRISLDYELSHDDLRAWLRLFPTLIILDGLDEVPSSSNRRDVISSIQNFLQEARDIEADLMIVASSRPEGYGGEFNGDEIAHRYLIPLSRTRALACAQRYVNAKIAATGKQRALEAMNTLTQAINNPLIEKLMHSPLQVTFMVTVVAASGKPSDSRWQLFNDYYRIIYERELHKAVKPFDVVLNERRQDIDSLHQEVGFILQHRAEMAGNTEADLAKTEFEDMVTAFLKENGLGSAELERQKEMILGAANLRLVFLTSRKPGRLSFDVRSLQEYMAAACITNGDSTVVIDRLEIIAHSAYWRNTLLFAVGRFFVEPHLRMHRDRIRILCDDLNLKEATNIRVKLGSWLALEILESGTVGNVPLVIRSLTECALELLGLPHTGDDLPRRLANVYIPETELAYREGIRIWTGQMNPPATYRAWLVVQHLAKNGIDWAAAMIDSDWPSDPLHAWNILRLWLDQFDEVTDEDEERCVVPPVQTTKLATALPLIDPGVVIDWAHPIKVDPNYRPADWIQLFTNWSTLERHSRLEVALTVDGENAPFLAILVGVPKDKDSLLFTAICEMVDSRPDAAVGWKVLSLLRPFYADPSAKSLAMVLRDLSAFGIHTLDHGCVLRLAWPLQCCLAFAESPSDLIDIAAYVETGKIGDVEQWRAQETKWLSQGVDIVQAFLPFYPEGPCLLDTLKRGRIVTKSKRHHSPDLVNKLFRLAESATRESDKSTLAWIGLFIAQRTETLNLADPTLLRAALLFRRVITSQTLLPANDFKVEDQDDWYDIFNFVGNFPSLQFDRHQWLVRHLKFDFYKKGYESDNKRTGILRLMGLMCAAGAKAQWSLPSLSHISKSDPGSLLFVILIKLSDSRLSREEAVEITSLIPVAVTARPSTVRSYELLLTTLELNIFENPALIIVFESILPQITNDFSEMHARATDLRLRLMESAPSNFNRESFIRLKLPYRINDEAGTKDSGKDESNF